MDEGGPIYHQRVQSSLRTKKVYLLTALGVLLLGMLGFLLFERITHKPNSAANQSQSQVIQAASLEQLRQLSTQDLAISPGGKLVVNGTLKSNGAFVLSGTATPANPEAGTVYLNNNDKKIYYYDGANFVEVLTGKTLKGLGTSIAIPNETGTLCLQNSPNCGFASNAALAAVAAAAAAGRASPQLPLGQAAPTSGNILIGNGTQWVSNALSGDAAINANGTLTVANGAINSAKILDGSVTGSDIANGTISNVNLQNSSVTVTAGTGLSGGGTVALGGNITVDSVLGTSIDTTEIANGTLLFADLAQNGCSTNDVILWSGAAWSCGTVSGGGGGITSLNGLVAAVQSFVDDTNIGVNSSGSTHTLTWTGTLAVGRGGTGAGSFTSNGLLYGNGAGALQVTAAGTSGQVPVANASGIPTFVSFGGDASLAASGTLTVNAGAITTGKILDGTILFADIAQNGCSSNEIIKWNGSAWACAADNSAPTGPAGGDLSGTYPNPTVAKINGATLGSATPTSGNILIGSGAAWVTQALGGDATLGATGTLTIGTGAITSAKIFDGTITGTDIAATTIANANLQNSSLTVTAGTGITGGGSVSLGGSVTINAALGTSVDSSEIVDGTILFADLNQNGCSSNDIIKWNGSAWACAADAVGATGANTALSNLASVAINTTLLPGAAGTIDLGSGTLPFGKLYISGTSGTPGSNNFTLTGAATSGRTITLPDATGTVCLDTGNCIGGGGAGSAPAGASYLTLGTDGNLSNERVLTAGTNIGFADAGANGALTISVSNSPTFSGTMNVQGDTVLGDAAADKITFTGTVQGATPLVFEGATVNSFTTSLAVQDPTANVTYRLATAAAGTYDICTTVSNCSATGAAGGDLSGTYPNPTVAKINGTTLGTTTATSGNILIGNGSQWVTQALGGDATLGATGTLTVGTGAITSAKIFDGTITGTDIAATTITNANLQNSSLTVTAGTGITGGGSVSLGGSVTVNAALGTSVDTGEIVDGTILFADLAQNGCSSSDIIKWNGSAWACAVDATGAGGVSTIGAIDGQTKSANGAVISGANLYMQSADASSPGLVTTGSQTFAGAKTFNNGIVVAASGAAITGNSTIAGTLGSLTGLTSSGTITFSGLNSVGVVQTNGSGVLSTSNLNLQTGPVTGVLQTANGGTGSNTTQGAINNISQLTTDGDLLYYNGTNSTRLARGTNGQCLTSNATTILWGSCLGSNGANTALSNLASVAINTSLLPGVAGTINLGSATLPFGTISFSGTSGTPASNNFTFTGAATSGRTITLPDATGTVCLSTGNCVGAGGGSAPNDASYLTLGTHANLSNERVLTAGNNIAAFTDGGANGTLTFGTVTNPTFSGTVSLTNATSSFDAGTASATTGIARFFNAGGSGSVNLQAANPGSSTFTLTLPGETGTLCTTAASAACTSVYGGASGVSAIGVIDSQTKSANGAVISGANLIMQTADASNVGLVSTAAQTFAGTKTFNNAIVAPTSSDTINGLVVNAGALSNVASVTGSGALTVSAGGTGAATYTSAAQTASASGAVTVSTGATSVGNNLASGALALTTGNATGTGASSNSGNISIDTGSSTNGSVGAINIGTTRGAVTVGTSGSGTVTLQGTTLALNAATWQRTAVGTTTLNLVDGSNTTLALTNSGAGVANLTVDGAITAATGLTATTGGLTVSAGGAAITGNSTIAGTLGSLTGLTSSGTITFSGLNSVGVVQTNGSGVLSTSNLNLQTGPVTGTLQVGNGGTGIASYTVGDLLYASGATTLSKLADVASGSCLISGGVGVAPSWGSCLAGGGVSTVGTFSNTATANGLDISGNTITLHAADASNPGAVSTGAQTFAGAKTFNSAIVAPTSSNTINGLVINSGALSSVASVTGSGALTVSAGGTGAATFTTAAQTASASGATTVSTGATSVGTSLASGNLVLSTGNATGPGAASNSGNITLDTGSSTNGSVGTIGIGTTRGAVTIGASGSGTVTVQGSTIALNAATLQRTAAGTTTIDLVDGSNTTLALQNSGAGVANLTVDGSITAGTGLTVTTGGLTVSAGGATINSTQGNLLVGGSNVIEAQTTGATTLFRVDSTGTVLVKTTSNSATALNITNSSNTSIFAVDTSANKIGTPNSAAANSTAVKLQSGNVTGGSALSTGSVTIQSGDGSGTNTSSGNVIVDAGTKIGTGTAGTVSVGTTNASSVSLGNASGTTTVTGSSILLNSATLQRTASGTTTYNLVDGSNTTLALTNSGAGVANFTTDGAITAATGLTATTGGLTVSAGGAAITGNSTIAGTLGSLTGLTSSGTITFSGLNSVGVVQTNGSGVLSTSNLNLQTGPITGVLQSSNGGTGFSTYTTGDILYASAANTVSKLARGTNGQCLTSNATTIIWGSCGGSLTVGALDGQPGVADGATITGGSLYLQSAGPTTPGLVTASGTQIFAGIKVFTGNLYTDGELRVRAGGYMALGFDGITTGMLMSGFMTNLLTNWDLRGGSVGTATTGTATINATGNCFVRPQSGCGIGTQIGNGASGGTVTITLTGLNIDVPANDRYTPYITFRSNSITPTAIKAELLSGDGTTWITLDNDTTASKLVTNMWVGSSGLPNTDPPKGVRYTITLPTTGNSTTFIRELGLFNANAPVGKYFHPDLGESNTFLAGNTFQGNLTVTSAGTVTFGGLNSVGVVQTNGSGVLSTSNLNLQTGPITGVLQSANGGTGFSTYTTGDLLYASGTNTVSKLARGTNGQCLISNATTILWGSCTGTSVTLQNAYDTGNTVTTTSARNLSFTLANTATDANFLVNIASGSTSKFAVQDNGTDILSMDVNNGLTVNHVSLFYYPMTVSNVGTTAQLSIKSNDSWTSTLYMGSDSAESNSGITSYNATGDLAIFNSGITAIKIDSLNHIGMGGGGSIALSNLFQVTPVWYSTGTASQSGTTVTGVGTTWTADMVGMELIFADGTKRTITARGSNTSLTVAETGAVSSQTYKIIIHSLDVTTNGDIGINKINPTARLSVVKYQGTVADFNRTGNDGTIIDLLQDGTSEGSISVAGTTVSYNAFTGSHFAIAAPGTIFNRGELVTLTGVNGNYHNKPESEILYGVTPATAENDPHVLGAFLAPLNPGKPVDAENPYQIMSVGNGDMWVVDEGQNIQRGDYLISSSTAGHARLDPRSASMSYVVARAAEDVNWSNVTATIGGKKHIKISVLFDSYTRDNLNAQTNAVLDTLTANSVVASGMNITANAIIGGNLNVSGSIAAANLTVTGTATINNLHVSNDAVFAKNITVNGHIISGGNVPTVQSQNIGLASAEVEGTDTAGTVTITVGASALSLNDAAAQLTFSQAFTATGKPRVVVSPANAAATKSGIYADYGSVTNQGFTLSGTGATLDAGSQLIFNYIVIQ